MCKQTAEKVEKIEQKFSQKDKEYKHIFNVVSDKVSKIEKKKEKSQGKKQVLSSKAKVAKNQT